MNEVQEIYARIKEIRKEYASVKEKLESELVSPEPVKRVARTKTDLDNIEHLIAVRGYLSRNYKRISSYCNDYVYQNVNQTSLPEDMQKIISPSSKFTQKLISLAEKRINVKKTNEIKLEILKLITFIIGATTLSPVIIPMIGSVTTYVLGAVGIAAGVGLVKLISIGIFKMASLNEFVSDIFLIFRKDRLRKKQEKFSKKPEFYDLKLEAIENLDKQILNAYSEEDLAICMETSDNARYDIEFQNQKRKIDVLISRREELKKEYKNLTEKLAAENKPIPSLIPDSFEMLEQKYNPDMNVEEDEKTSKKEKENQKIYRRGYHG